MLLNDICKLYLLPSVDRLNTELMSNKSYKRVVIDDKNHTKKRIVYVPSAIVKMAQQYLLVFYLSKIEYHECAIAYTKEKSIVDNASIHVNNNHFLHIDIKNFFDNMDWTIFEKMVVVYFKESDFYKLLIDSNDRKDVMNILMFRKHFRQGSVTSPVVSNIYLYEFDCFMKNLVKSIPNGCYSRYSDDIYISSKSVISSDIISLIAVKLKEYHLRINYKKLGFASINDYVKITGLTLTSSRTLTLSTKYKKHLKSEIYNFLNGKNNNIKGKELLGRLYYLKMVDINYFNYLQIKYGNEQYTALDRIINKIDNNKTSNEQSHC